jgi:hypothetical protein
MPSDPPESPAPSDPTAGPRHSGRAALLGVLGIALMMIGSMLVAMLQAPVVRPRVVVTGFVLIPAGLVLSIVAWLCRHPGPS